MAKALLGHVRGPDQRLAAELRRLRRRVGDLEAQLARLAEQRETRPAGPLAAGPLAADTVVGRPGPAAPPVPRRPSA
jgi:hypothetical protein